MASTRARRASTSVIDDAPRPAAPERRTAGAAAAAGLGHPVLLSLASAGVVMAAWEYAGRVPISPAFPTFLETMATLWAMLLDGSLPKAFWITLQPLAVKGVVIGQLLVSIVGFGRLFELYSSRFLMEHFWALLFVLFAFAFVLNELLAWLERRVEYYAAARH